MNDALRVLLLPGWLDSGPTHWQTRWQALRGFDRVQQADWEWPRRGDWMARLEERLLQNERPSLLVAHSLGCHLVAAWAAHSRHTTCVMGALLVAPPDTERDSMPPQLHNWRPMVRASLPFAATMLYSEDDPYCAPERARGLAQSWCAAAHSVGAAGHINGDSGLGDWPVGLVWLQALMKAPDRAPR